MAPLPSKRRKLDHDINRDELEGSDLSSIENVSRASSERSISPEGKPLPRSSHLKSNTIQGVGDNALFTDGIYNSSMFKLQVDEMLSEVRLKEAKRDSINEALRQLKQSIEGMENREPLPISDAIKSLKARKISIPFPDPKPEKTIAYKFGYMKPEKINVVGSYALDTVTSSNVPLSVDMVVMMPASLFQEKDFLNYRYFYKRAYYLACIAAGLQDVIGNKFAFTFKYLNGNTLQPVLVAKPSTSSIDQPTTQSPLNFAINIIPAIPHDLFPELKLRPTRNSIRPKEHAIKEGKEPTPSPFYNATIRSDSNFEPYLKLLHSASKQTDGFKDFCILGRIWLKQRGFISDLECGGFGHFEWSTLAALLLKGGGPKGNSVLSPGYSSYQMFKAMIQFLATTDLAAKPLLIHSSELSVQPSDSPMLYDGSRGQNILYKMTPWAYRQLREEAKLSLDMLNDSTFDQFDSTFIIHTDLSLHKFDCIIRIPIHSQPPQPFSCDHHTHISLLSHKLYEVLREGLTDRVRVIDIKLPPRPSWSLKSDPRFNQEESLLVSLVFDPANIERLVDHGPPAAEKKKAAKFQKFWGEKAELRRFKDGSILESLVWSPGSAYSILREIFTYLIKRHFDSGIIQDLHFVGDAFEKHLPSGTNRNRFDALKEAFNNFEKQIRNLEGLPLQLRSISPISPQLRYSSINPPLFGTTEPLTEPADVLIQFEGSGRWPDSIAAIQKTKAAFLLKIGNLFEDLEEVVETRVGLENEDRPLLNCSYLDILYQSGAVFRVRIHTEREQTLLERLVKDKSSDHHTREDAVQALSVYRRLFIQLPLHSQSISTHCTRFPFLSPAIRLTKLWFDRHMLSEHVSEELIELLAAHTFLHNYPWRNPSSTMTGFLRTILFISRWDWRLTPLIVDFNGTMTTKDVTSINTRLEAWRKIDPGMQRTVIFAASNHDSSGVAFTDKGPSKMVAARMTTLARSVCKLVKEQGIDLDVKSLFSASIQEYDFAIHLAPKFTNQKRKTNNRHARFKNLEVQSEESLDTVGYNPVQLYLDELKTLYAASIVFFKSNESGSVITGLWNPQTAPRQFKVNIRYATKPIVGEKSKQPEDVEIDKSTILSEISRIGGDLVSKIEVHK